ncbi:restriction endonuclease [Chitinophaga sp. GCM10012297]|uniref:Restriction endonuclease n=1 Tax=Chitinophaga chungangae TaxID=2821488 RepID=A0ABS3Y8J5_9BACT|nr:restriction endonuclease [Chitinophaga chungangae]MBO9150976.1 restriction endonuclease [Chitinophaga chungangae]
MDWKELETKVADIFKLFGYDVTADTKIDAAQTDAIATSHNKFKPRILIECKFHESAGKVGINEVENFKARVLTLRMKGKIDQGYLITNTGFTASAKESLSDAASYVFLMSYDDLLHQMIDVDYYLKNFVERYEKERLQRYVDLRIIDISQLQTLNYNYVIEELMRMEIEFHSTQRFGMFYEDLDIRAYLEKGRPLSARSRRARESIEAWRKAIFEKIDLFSSYISSFTGSDQNVSIVLADFGGGKSTSLEHTMYCLAKAKLENIGNGQQKIPLLLTLKHYNKVPDIDSMLINFFTTEIGYSNINLQVFKRMNELGHFVILLDGFDEMAKLVTPIERKLTFIEICKLVTPNNKVILSSRPGYFPENKEFGELLRKYLPRKKGDGTKKYCGIHVPDNCRIACLQLMDTAKINEYIKKAIDSGDKDKIEGILRHKSVRDLAARPVLLNIISETYDDLKDLPDEEVSLKKLYDIYTSKWINREEDKGLFRVLINADEKLAFIVLLAVQMHEQDSLEVHFSVLDKLIRDRFGIDNQEKVDHFSHDIRTCAFLNRDDQGNYAFIHRSFLEYFVAREFYNFRAPIYGDRFYKLFSDGILSFIDIYDKTFGDIFSSLKEYRLVKNEVVKKQKFEMAANLREAEKDLYGKIQGTWPDFKDIAALNSDYRQKLGEFVIE